MTTTQARRNALPAQIDRAARPALDEPYTEHDATNEHPPISQRVTNLLMILLPLVALVVGMVYAWGWGLTWVELTLMLVMYMLTGLGVTIGFHRLFAHKSFSTGRTMTTILGILGSMSVEGSIHQWVSMHRCHHRHSDQVDDPHSPHGHGSGLKGLLKGFWIAHMGWMLRRKTGIMEQYVPDLRRSKLVNTISALFPLWVLLSLALPTAIGGLITLSWTGALLGFLWGGLIRIFMVHHLTWSVNSICHLWGTRPYRTKDESRNNPIVGVLAFGEGWHNNHHAFPASARHGLRWWEFDMSYIVIWTLARVGLVWNVRLPPRERMITKRRVKNMPRP